VGLIISHAADKAALLSGLQNYWQALTRLAGFGIINEIDYQYLVTVIAK
jgi:hypothetical protein